jgi:hypothetical protein
MPGTMADAMGGPVNPDGDDYRRSALYLAD